MPPQPTYLDNISCSSGVAFLFSFSSSFSSVIAAMLFCAFVFVPPSPKFSFVIRKLTAFTGSFIFSSDTVSFENSLESFTLFFICSCNSLFINEMLSFLKIGKPTLFSKDLSLKSTLDSYTLSISNIFPSISTSVPIEKAEGSVSSAFCSICKSMALPFLPPSSVSCSGTVSTPSDTCLCPVLGCSSSIVLLSFPLLA